MDYHQKPRIDYPDGRRPIVRTYCSIGRVCVKLVFQTSESELAREHLERVAILDPEVPRFHVQPARNHLLRGDWTGASKAV